MSNDYSTIICSLPWTNFLVERDGTVRVCCFNGTILGNLKEQSVDEIWHGANFTKLREAISNNDFSNGCRRDCPVIKTVDN